MPSRRLHTVALSHVAAEDLGSLRPHLERRGFAIETVQVASGGFPASRALDCDLLVVLGGPIGVYDCAEYPFLNEEIEGLRQRLAAGRPTLGICLGAQLMAAALDARVYPGARGAEIGWFRLLPAGAEPVPQWLAPLVSDGLHVFHWHGDTFELPGGSQHLARTERYDNQAFTVGDFALALQFHPEVTASGLESWYVAHASELRQKGISVPELRAAARKYGPALEAAADVFWQRWLDHIL
jgi:GMP synthase (glutamine-hydrolysing)